MFCNVFLLLPRMLVLPVYLHLNFLPLRFSAGRRRYHIFFNEMMQVNEESGAKKVVIMMYKKRDKNNRWKVEGRILKENFKLLSDWYCLNTKFIVR